MKSKEYEPDIKVNLMSGKIEGKTNKMDTKIMATLMVRGTEQDIRRMKARIASLTVYEEVISLYIKEEQKNGKRKENGE